MRRLLLPALLAASLAVLPTAPAAARGGVWFGIGVGPGWGWGWGYPAWPVAPWWAPPAPVWYGPPAYPAPYAYSYGYAPPAHAAPARPPAAQARRETRQCHAWPVTCRLSRPLPEGTPCGCPSNQGNLPGTAGL